MDAFGRWQIALTSASVIVPWVLPDIDISLKIIIVLSILLISCLLYCFRLHRRIDNLSKECNEISNKHKALAKRFDERRAEVRTYISCIESIEYLILSTVQSTRQERLIVLYDSFLKIKASLALENKEGK